MGFAYPLFLLAATALVIPLLIHLFNLRRYKKVFFPHTRFLQQIQLRSRKQKEIQQKWLLATRLLLLAALVLAFSQPFWGNSSTAKGSNVQAIYIDNSPSMAQKKGARDLFTTACDAAIAMIEKGAPGTQYILLSNDRPYSYEPLSAEKTQAAIRSLTLSPIVKNNTQIFTSLQSIMQSSIIPEVTLYYYSDFQKISFPTKPSDELLKGITFRGVNVQPSGNSGNLYIDTAYILSPVLQTGSNTQLLVKTRLEGKLPAATPVLQLSVYGQVKGATALSFDAKNERTDTLSFLVNDANWQQIAITVNDGVVSFDDTFRIAAKSTPGSNVLVLNEQEMNPYIHAAYTATNGFRIVEEPITSIVNSNLQDYNLIILNNVKSLSDLASNRISEALARGQNICILPAKTQDINALNSITRNIADVRFTSLDTENQTAAYIQRDNPLIKDIFEQIPENIQLPTAAWHYKIESGLDANAQSIISFRNGDPFFAKYTAGKGNIFLCATSAEMETGNFTASYFFAPLLYQMAMQQTSSNINAIAAGTSKPLFINIAGSEQNMIHIRGNGIDAIPQQKAVAGGVEIFVGDAVKQAGFYNLSNAKGENAQLAINASRKESALDRWTLDELQTIWKGKTANWFNIQDQNQELASLNNTAAFPLWKLCLILALVLLAIETWLLVSPKKERSIATT